ncbi:hypothetical protein PS3A_51030 [Pseudomonas sp. 3A(2025)]
MSLGVDNIQLIAASAFAPTARLTSYACRTGMGNPQDMDIENAVQLNPQPELSLAQQLADHLKLPVRAFITRSDYKETWGSFAARRLADACTVTSQTVPSEEWCAQWKSSAAERKKSQVEKDFAYQTSGALNSVIPGTTPHGPEKGLIEFKPNE